MSVPLLLGLTDPEWEAGLVSAFGAGRHPVEVARRCVDLADLLAAAAAGIGRAALVSADLRRLDQDAIVRLAATGTVVVGVVDADDEPGERRLRQWGVRHVVTTGSPPDAVAEIAVAAGSDVPNGGHDYADPRPPGRPTVAAAGDDRAPASPASVEQLADRPHPVIAVWGPAGAPGRSTIAVNLAAELAAALGSALLVDADVYGASLAQLLGLLDESPGLAAACRLANAGRLDVPALAGLVLEVRAGLRVLTGISRSDRWPELRPRAVADALALGRRLAAVVVVDCSFCLEQDEELSFDTAAPRRNGATLAALEAADVVVALGSADPVGLARLVRGLESLREVVPETPIRVVVNRCRRGPVPGDPRRAISAALARHAGVDDPAYLPDDRAACDAALAEGRTVAEVAPGSPLRAAIADLATAVVGACADVPVEGIGSRRSGLRRRVQAGR